MTKSATVYQFVKPKGKQMEYLLERYQKAHPNATSIEPHRIAEWGIEKGLWKRPPIPPEERLRRELSRYLRGEYTTDPQGRSVRKHHAVIYMEETEDGPKKRSRWYEIYDAPAKHMRASLALRRRAAFNDVKQLDLDLQSYNENNHLGETIPPMDYNFNLDLHETSLPTHYPVEGPATDEDGEPI